MKRALSIIVIALCITVMAMGQTREQGRFALGGKTGATFSRVNFNPSVQQSMLPGMTAGVMFRYIEEKSFGLVAELNVAGRGWNEAFDDADYSYRHRFTCIEVPVMTHIYFGNKRVKGFFNVGPELNVLIADGVSSNFDYREAAANEYFTTNARRIEQMTMGIKNRLDYGICGGAGIEIGLSGRQSLLLEGRFYYGLTDVFPNHKTDVFSSSNSMTVSVTLGYFYCLGGKK